MDASMIPIARLDALPDNAPAHAEADGIHLVPVRRACVVHVFEGRCPHRGALLSDGLPVRAGEQLTRYLGAITELVVVLARACGHDSLSHFTPRDLTSRKRDVADLVGVSYAGVAR